MAQAKDRKQAPGRQQTRQSTLHRREMQLAGREEHANLHSRGNGGGASSRGHDGRSGSGGSGGNGRADHQVSAPNTSVER